MPGTVGIGIQDFKKLRERNAFYIDKTMFIREWWESLDDVTLITRPRRFGKTLTLNMVKHFFSIEDAESNLFCGLNIWEDEKYRRLQGRWPVIFMSFSGIKENLFSEARKSICRVIEELYNQFDFLLDTELLNDKEKRSFNEVSAEMGDSLAAASIRMLSDYLYRYYRKRVIILLDEYDTPMQEAYVNGYWSEMSGFTRSLFNGAFKNNPYMERGIMTGITRVSKESVFSDLNNLTVVTTTSSKYAEAFGFTEQEVFAALEEYELADKMDEVRKWYDGFAFGGRKDIYNPWSVINYLSERKPGPYWVNTSSNSLIGKLIREGTPKMKETFERLLTGESIRTEIDEQIVYNQLDQSESAIWSLLLASGYLRVKKYEETTSEWNEWKQIYEVEITNFEVRVMFRNMVRGWFSRTASNYNDFVKALLENDVRAMNVYMNRVAMSTFSFFDSGNHPSGESEPERFYHGFVLGLMVELEGRYRITSNRESGFGRYDVCMEPRNRQEDAFILEFKVRDPREEECLEDTVQAALDQIEEKAYAEELIARGIEKKKIREYGFAFQGKTVLIGTRNQY